MAGQQFGQRRKSGTQKTELGTYFLCIANWKNDVFGNVIHNRPPG